MFSLSGIPMQHFSLIVFYAEFSCFFLLIWISMSWTSFKWSIPIENAWNSIIEKTLRSLFLGKNWPLCNKRGMKTWKWTCFAMPLPNYSTFWIFKTFFRSANDLSMFMNKKKWEKKKDAGKNSPKCSNELVIFNFWPFACERLRLSQS